MHARAYSINEHTDFHLTFIKTAAGCKHMNISHSVCKVDKCRARLYMGGIRPINKHADNATCVVLKKTNSKAFYGKYECKIIQNGSPCESSDFTTESSVTAWVGPRYQLSIWGKSRKPIHFNQLSEEWSHVRWSHPVGHNSTATSYYY